MNPSTITTIGTLRASKATVSTTRRPSNRSRARSRRVFRVVWGRTRSATVRTAAMPSCVRPADPAWSAAASSGANQTARSNRRGCVTLGYLDSRPSRNADGGVNSVCCVSSSASSGQNGRSDSLGAKRPTISTATIAGGVPNARGSPNRSCTWSPTTRPPASSMSVEATASTSGTSAPDGRRSVKTSATAARPSSIWTLAARSEIAPSPPQGTPSRKGAPGSSDVNRRCRLSDRTNRTMPPGATARFAAMVWLRIWSACRYSASVVDGSSGSCDAPCSITTPRSSGPGEARKCSRSSRVLMPSA